MTAIRRATSLVGIEVRRNYGVLLLPVMVLFAWYQVGRSLDDMSVPLWVEASRVTGLSALYVAPFVATLATWNATRERYAGAGAWLSVTPMPPFGRHLVMVAGAALWGLLGMALIGGWIGLRFMLDDAWGSPSALLLGIGAVTIVIAAILGQVVGTVIATRYAAPIVGLLFALGSAMPSYWAGNSRLLSPWRFLFYDGTSVFRATAGEGAGAQLLWLTGVALLVLALLAIRFLSFRAAVLATVGMLLFGATGLSGFDHDRRAAAAFSPVCQPVIASGPEICLHPAYGRLLPRMVALATPMAMPLLGSDGLPGLIVQSEGLGPTGAPGDATIFVTDRADWEIQFVVTLAERLVGYTPGSSASLEPEYPSAAQVAVGHWLIGQSAVAVPDYLVPPSQEGYTARLRGDRMMSSQIEADIFAATDRLAAMTPELQQRWFQTHLAGLRDGTVALTDIE